jgi:hypothetical protein
MQVQINNEANKSHISNNSMPQNDVEKEDPPRTTLVLSQ